MADPRRSHCGLPHLTAISGMEGAAASLLRSLSHRRTFRESGYPLSACVTLRAYRSAENAPRGRFRCPLLKLFVLVRIDRSLLELFVCLFQQLLCPLRMVSEFVVPRRLGSIDLPFRGGDQMLRFSKVRMDVRIDVLLANCHATCKQYRAARSVNQNLFYLHDLSLESLRTPAVRHFESLPPNSSAN